MMDGDWAILDVDAYVDCRELYRLVKARKLQPQAISIDDIAHKPLCSINETQGRYIKANTLLPVLLCSDMPSPDNKAYRMLDGRHRLLKAKADGLISIQAYVVSKQDVMKFVRT